MEDVRLDVAFGVLDRAVAAQSSVGNRALGCCWPRRRPAVYKLLGGKVRDRVRVYNGGGGAPR